MDSTKNNETSTPNRGLGDTIAKVTHTLGIDKVVKAVVGDDCGCKKRQEKLNELVPYSKKQNNDGKTN